MTKGASAARARVVIILKKLITCILILSYLILK